MTFTITIGWIVVPILVTLGMLVWAYHAPPDGGFLDLGLNTFFRLFVTLFVSLIAWIIYGVFG